MRRELFHIYGPLSIQGYGLAIVIGIIVVSWFFLTDKRREHLLSYDNYTQLLFGSIISATIGGRLLAVLTDEEPFSLYQLFVDGGLSVLGSLIALLIFIPLALRRMNVAIKPTLDLIAVYAPLLQAIARIGCFAAGCCYGNPTSVPWAISYSDPHSMAPLHCLLHPTQLYSSLLLTFLFVALYINKERLLSKKIALEWYLIGMGTERFVVDFFRADQQWINSVSGISSISTYQLISLAIIIGSIYSLLMRKKNSKGARFYESL